MTAEFGPIETPPWSLLPPYDEVLGATRDDMQAAIREALRGVELGEYDTAILEWLAGWDVSTVATVVSWIERVRKAGDRLTQENRQLTAALERVVSLADGMLLDQFATPSTISIARAFQKAVGGAR